MRCAEVFNQAISHSNDDERTDLHVRTVRSPKRSLFGAQNKNRASKMHVAPVTQERFEPLRHVFNNDLPLPLAQTKGPKLRYEQRLCVSLNHGHHVNLRQDRLLTHWES